MIFIGIAVGFVLGVCFVLWLGATLAVHASEAGE
jgi:hypothetical protein